MDDARNTTPLATMAEHIRANAELLLRLGPAAYLAAEAPGLPMQELDKDDLDTVRRGCEQLLGGRGFSKEAPLAGLGNSGFYILMRLFRCTMVGQAAYDHGACFLDGIEFQHTITGDRTTMWNLVPKVF